MVVPARAGAVVTPADRGDETMSLGEFAAVLTHRSGAYALALIAVMAGLAFMFSFTTFFGGTIP
jgi:hypothetical protein